MQTYDYSSFRRRTRCKVTHYELQMAEFEETRFNIKNINYYYPRGLEYQDIHILYIRCMIKDGEQPDKNRPDYTKVVDKLKPGFFYPLTRSCSMLENLKSKDSEEDTDETSVASGLGGTSSTSVRRNSSSGSGAASGNGARGSSRASGLSGAGLGA